MSYLEKLIGKTIVDVQISKGTYYPLHNKEPKRDPQIVEELLIDFNDYKITISNPYSINDSNGINSLLNTTIKSVFESETEAIFITTAGQSLTVDLRKESYVGPEAIFLIGPNNLFVAWN